MSEFDLITFVGISESWHAFDESRFNTSFSISNFEILFEIFIRAFTFYCNDNRIFILFYWSCYWILNMIDIYWLVVIFWNIYIWNYIDKKLLRTSATLSLLSKSKSYSTNVVLLWTFFRKKRLNRFPKSFIIGKVSWSRLL